MTANISLEGPPAAAEPEPQHRVKVCIATPTQGASTVFPHVASIRRVIWALEQNGAERTELLDEWVEADARELLHYPTDVVRSRSRMVRLVQKHSKATHVLWLDDDMSFDPNVAVYMLSLALKYDLDCVGAVYPRKFHDEAALVEKVEWALNVVRRYEDGKGHIIPPPPTEVEYGRAKKVLEHPLRFAFRQQSYAVYNEPGDDPRVGPHSPHPWLWQLDGLGMGFMVTTRRMLDALADRYREELFVHDADPQIGDMTAMFMLEITDPNRHLLSEDNAMLRRWRRMGGKVYGYVGPGQVLHHGTQAFEADVSCLLGEEFAQAIEKIGEPGR